jgi:hypothetical protein
MKNRKNRKKGEGRREKGEGRRGSWLQEYSLSRVHR